MQYCGSYVFASNAIHLCPNMPQLFLQFLKLLFCLDTVSQKCRLGNVLAIKVGKCFSHKSKAFSGDVLVNILLHTEGSCRQGRKGSSAHL